MTNITHPNLVRQALGQTVTVSLKKHSRDSALNPDGHASDPERAPLCVFVLSIEIRNKRVETRFAFSGERQNEGASRASFGKSSQVRPFLLKPPFTRLESWVCCAQGRRGGLGEQNPALGQHGGVPGRGW